MTPDLNNRAHGSVDVANVINQGRKRNTGPAGYTGEGIIGNQEAPKKRRKKAKKSNQSTDDHELKRLEAEIELKKEQAKNLKAQKEIDQLRAQVEELQSGTNIPKAARRQSANQSKLRSDLARVEAERDRLAEENERLRNSKPPAVNGRMSTGNQRRLRQLEEELKEMTRQRNVFEMKYDAIMKTKRGQEYAAEESE